MTDDQLRDFAFDFRQGILGQRGPDGMSFAVSAPLSALLRLYGVPCEAVASDHTDLTTSEWHDHYWIKLADGRALDPTFDQFGGDPIYLGPPTEFHG